MDKNKVLSELEKMQELHRKQASEKREAIKQRKVRTRRLIVRGAIAEKVVPNAESMSDELFQQELYRLAGKCDIATSHPQDSGGRPLRENPSGDTS